MSLDLYLAFIAAVVVLMLIPGPNVALIVANSIAAGTRCGLLTVAGTSTAFALQLVVASMGLTAMLALLSEWFEWLRWAGVAYLLYLGIQAWRAPPVDLAATKADPGAARRMMARGFLISLTNPKALLFLGAFFPQFLTPGAALGPQLAILSLTFLAIAIVVDSGWALLAGRLRHLLATRTRLRNRLTGGLFIGAALGLAAARRGS
jgi:homoserine/homoserine lactone efflux protein